MVALSFSEPKHLPLLKNGKKRQTIRRDNPVRIEQMKRLGLQIYWKQRTPDGYKLHDGKYKGGFDIQFRVKTTSIIREYWLYYRNEIYKNWTRATINEEEIIAIKDGFGSYAEMVRWFEKKHGDLNNEIFNVIRWLEIQQSIDGVNTVMNH